MKLIVITDNQDSNEEISLLESMARTEVHAIHLRKQNWSINQQLDFLLQCSPVLISKIVLHQFVEHCSQFAVMGWHRNMANEGAEKELGNPISASWKVSGQDGFKQCEYALCSPIFPSISKPGHGPNNALAGNMVLSQCMIWENDTRKESGESKPEKIALSGIQPEYVPDAYNLGFDGVAVCGYIWQSEDPILALSDMINACNPE